MKNLKYVSENSDAIYMDWHHPTLGLIPFVARPDDVEAHGRDKYQRAVAGEWGEIAPYEPPIETLEDKATLIRGERDSLLRELDNVVINPLRYASYSDDEKQELANYRQYLLDIPQQDGFPENVVFKEKPKFIK